MSAPRHLGLSLGMIDSLSDGLGEFSTQICTRVAAVAGDWRREGIHIHLHLPQRWHGRFGPDVGYLATRKLQGHWHWQGTTRFDVWHALHQLGRTLPPWRTRHAVLTVHDLNALHDVNTRDPARFVRKLTRRLHNFDELTTLTRHVERDIRTHLGWHGPLTVIPNGARDLTQHPRQPVVDVAEGAYLLTLGRMTPSKNPQALIDLAAQWPGQAFVLAGPGGSDAQQVIATVRARGLANVKVLCDVSDAQKAWLYANCRAFVFPSLTEGFGLPPLEAMHFGKPVFLSNRTSLPEVGGDAAVYFSSFEPLAMRALIESQLPALAAREASIRAHAARFNWDACASRYLAIYRRLLAPI